MIRRNYLGLDIAAGQLRAVSLHRKGRSSVLQGGRMITLGEGVLVPSLSEPNIHDPRRFVEDLHEVLDPMAGKEERIALSLPETSGHILLTEVETDFKNRDEGIEILKWQLRNSLPVDPAEVQLDFQLLEKTEGGGNRLMVGLTTTAVLEQYEKLLAGAGYNATVIDFHSLNLLNFYNSRLDPGDEFFLVGVEGPVLSLQLFQGGLLRFHRSRELQPSAEKMFSEVGRTLVGCQEAFPALRRAAVFLHSDWEDEKRQELIEALRSAFEREVALLDPHLERLAAESLDIAEGPARRMVGAIGAAERMMR